MAECVPVPVQDVAGLRQFAEERQIDLTVVGPELPLTLGIADEFRRAKLRIFGPTRNAARIESSKSFSKALMMRCKIPTARAQTFDRLDHALRYLESHPTPVVVKADGLAQGKGVIVASSQTEAKAAVTAMLGNRQFGEASDRVVIEDFVEGQELTVMAFADGRTVVPMVAAQDHKRIGEGDTGSNTGGMGAYTPTPIITDNLRLRVLRDVLYPVVEGLSRMGSPFYGVVYAGLMISSAGDIYVLEFNARFGDPETQVVLPLLATDLVDVLEAVAEHRLDQVHVEWSQQAAVCVVLTSEGYPGSYKKGVPISGLPNSARNPSVVVFHAGTAKAGDEYVTSGGRVLGVTGLGEDLQIARTRAYEAIKSISFDGCYYRRDIAQRAVSTAL